MDKAETYRVLESQLAETLRGVSDPVAILSSTAALVHHALPQASWTGFYRVVEDQLLRVGPYQGPLGCLEIAFDRGVCGAAASQRKTVVVSDVHAFPGHIACDSQTRSEIVVPVFDRAGTLYAVLDVDSRTTAAFDQDDQQGLERIAATLSSLL